MELPVRMTVSRNHRIESYKLETINLGCRISAPYEKLSWIQSYYNPKVSTTRFILHNVNSEARAGEITAIAGPSGAGKSTLLEILAGKTRAGRVTGQVLVNGYPMVSKVFQRISGYVTQEDALFPLLTVKETLIYSSLLRLSGSREMIEGRVRSLIRELGLCHVADSEIGEGSNRGISGGERRRVSIGVELVHDPSVILIDEPTSGLDSASALQIITLLKSMAANQGKTIALTIHQPGYRILEQINRLILLSNGTVLHNGTVKNLEERLNFCGFRIPRHINVLEFAIDVTASLAMQYPEIIEEKEVKGKRLEDHLSIKTSFSYSNSRFQEVIILSQRFFKNVFRTKQLFSTRVIQAIVAGLVLGTIFMNIGNDPSRFSLQTQLGFFAFSLTFLLSSTTEGLPIFLQERRILMRETSRGAYRVSSYVIANTLVFLPFLLMVSLLYSSSVYFLVGLRHETFSFLYFSLVVWIVVLMSNSFTACFSALVPNFIMGTSVIAGLMGSFFLFSGYFIAKENIPKYWIFMHYMSLFKYPFECFIINEYGGKEGEMRCVEGDEGSECRLFGNGLLKQQGLVESQKWTNLAVMFSFIVGYRIICFIILWVRCHIIRN
ncbi:ABC transporter G family member 10 [Impatiens glandulifera]|uniref:ABC transporter G family member 10 n=1 Tax=Impatiens glandulifera TaxID=253017 RepID=UPI001FB0F5AC|nr:ABC transporter G family member 10 [Impatiens glandulifera]